MSQQMDISILVNLAKNLDLENRNACVAFGLLIAQATSNYSPRVSDEIIEALTPSLYKDFWAGTLRHGDQLEHAEQLVMTARALHRINQISTEYLQTVIALEMMAESLTLGLSGDYIFENGGWSRFS